MKVLTIMMIFLLMLGSLYINGVQSSKYDIIYDARLSGGYSGIVQVLTHLGWQNLCSSSWSTYSNSEESRVLCRQLGYDVTSSDPSTSRSSSSSTSSYFSSFSCSGCESAISECNFNLDSEPSSCSYVVSVTCPSCTTGSVQLHGGVVPEAGTVEYCVNGTWKAVCDRYWDYRDAFVVCRQLGFPATGATAYANSYFGDHLLTSGLYFRCQFGNESSLSSCPSFTITCDSANTAGVYCTGDAITELCIDGHTRLVGGRDTREGRVEICSNGLWGTIFSGFWDSRDATVVCRQLGLYQPYSRVEVFERVGYFGPGTGPFLYAFLSCDGTESTLRDCSYADPESYTKIRRHSSDAGVRCNRVVTTTLSDCSNGDVRLVNGTTLSEGRVEICYGGVWGSVCDFNWRDQDAAIVCLQLNFPGTNATALTGSYFGSGTGPYHLSNVGCSGEERTLLECSYSGSRTGMYHSCGPGLDAGVRCDVSTCTHGDVRLFGGYNDHDGVAEVCINGLWADICDDGMSNQTVRTFCRQFIGAEASYARSSCCLFVWWRNTGNITLDGINCSGQSGSFLQDCTYSTVSGSSSGGCSVVHKLIVGCYEQSSCTNGDVRLSGGSSTSEGRVEVCTQGVWGAFIPLHSYPFLPDYSFYHWDYNGAMVVCRQLGYPSEWAIPVDDGFFGRSFARHEAMNFQCNGTESRITDCSSLIASSARWYENYPSAGVICQGNTSAPTECEHGEVRLVGGQKITEGRMEICAYGYWAAVCYRYWSTVGTELVCKHLGFPSDGSEYRSDCPFGSNYDLPLVGVSCGVSDTNINQCNIFTQLSGCDHRNGIGIFCQEREQYYFVKIDKLSDQQTYDIGSHVTLKCTVSDLNETSYVTAWSSALGSASSSHTTTTSIPAYSLSSIDYYCQPSHNGRILGRQRITLDIKGLLQGNVSGTNTTNIQVRQQETVHLHVEPVDINVVKGLLELTWYHNGSVIAASQNQRYTISNRNKTLTITHFTFADAGVYEAQFNQLFVHPFDEHCRDEVLSLLRHLPVLKPAVFCVNMEGSCPDVDKEQVTQLRTISLKVVRSELKGTLNNITLKAYGKVFSSEELKHSSIQWYRNGQSIFFSLSSNTLQKNYTELSLSQELKLFNILSYEQSGRYEVLLQVNMYNYLRDRSCRPYYDRFTRGYLRRDIPLAQGYVDIDYYKDQSINLTTDKEATTIDEVATLTCRASIGIPPLSMVSFIKNGETVANSTSGQLQIDTRSFNANPFGLYICQLNASGLIFNETIIIKDQALIMIKIYTANSTNICNEQSKSAIEDALVSKISDECQCSFDHNDLRDSSIVCKGSELVYTATMEYSTEDGSETASVIAERIVTQATFAMAFAGIPVTVTTACSDCQNLIISNSKINAASLSPAAGGGLFFGGILTALVVIGIIIIVIMVIMKTKCNNMDPPGNQHAAQPDPISDSKGDLVRNPSYCVHRRMRVAASLQRQDYEEVEIIDQPVYEAAF